MEFIFPFPLMRAQLAQYPPAVLNLWSYLRLPINLPFPWVQGPCLLHVCTWQSGLCVC